MGHTTRWWHLASDLLSMPSGEVQQHMSICESRTLRPPVIYFRHDTGLISTLSFLRRCLARHEAMLYLNVHDGSPYSMERFVRSAGIHDMKTFRFNLFWFHLANSSPPSSGCCPLDGKCFTLATHSNSRRILSMPTLALNHAPPCTALTSEDMRLYTFLFWNTHGKTLHFRVRKFGDMLRVSSTRLSFPSPEGWDSAAIPIS
jgi:hypothetical protein